MLLRRFPILNSLPLKALKAQGDVRRTIHSGVARELLRRESGVAASGDGSDLLSRLSTSLVKFQLYIIKIKQNLTFLPDSRCTRSEEDFNRRAYGSCMYSSFPLFAAGTNNLISLALNR